MTLPTELERVREYLTGANPPPANEANTCDWVILPLLRHCGYHYHDIHAQGHDAAGGIPDYTILPNTAQTWYLEAKKWSETLSDTHINQAANYVNTTAKRWFVVSNGREWRLYDNYNVQVPPSERVVVVARLNCGTELEGLLAALSKASVQSGALESYALKTRLHTLLQHELATPNSDVIQAITKVCKNKSGLSTVTTADIAAYFHAFNTGTALSVPSTPTVSTPAPPPVQPTLVSAPSPANGYTLPDLVKRGNAIEGKKPQSLAFPDGTIETVSSWRSMAVGIIEWLFTRGKMPNLPFTGGKGNKCYLISTTPLHPTGKLMEHSTIHVNGHSYHIDVVRSSRNYVSHLNALCQEVGEPPEGFRVTLQ